MVKIGGKQVVAGVVLGAAGFAGNWFSIHLTLDIDFLFGSFFVMTALLRFGVGAGALASLIASSCTWVLWHHPHAMLIFTVETAFVGFLNQRRKKTDILFHDILFWLFIGGPLAWFAYNQLLHETSVSAVMIMLKQAVNGIFNALLASILYLLLLSREDTVENYPSFRQVVFTIMVSLVLIPAFLFIFQDLRTLADQRNSLLATQSTRAADMAVAVVGDWLAKHQQIVNTIAQRVGDPQKQRQGEMQEVLETVKSVTPSFKRMGIFDREATTVAFTPRFDALGHTTIGISYADREYVQVLKKDRKPYVAGVLPGRMVNSVPVVPFVSPILVGGEFRGYCAGALETDVLLAPLRTIVGEEQIHITILDQFGRVVISTRRDLVVVGPYVRPVKGAMRQVSAGVTHLIPAPEMGRDLMQRWSDSWYLVEKKVGADPQWQVIVENSYAPLLVDLRAGAITALAGLIVLSLLIAPISNLLSRRMTRSLERLRISTRSLPDDIRNNQPESLPDSTLQEVAELVENFRSTRQLLKQQHDSLLQLNAMLQERNASLAVEEERFRTLVEVAPYAVLVNRCGVIEYVNPAAVVLLGASSAEQLLGRSTVALLNNDAQELIEEQIEQLLAGDSTLKEAEIIRLDGVERSIEMAAASFVDSKGVAFYLLLLDITERKRAEERLQRAKQEWERTFDSVPDLIAILDDQHRIIRVNRAMARHLGREPRECIGQYCHEVIHGTACPPDFCPYNSMLCDLKAHEVEVSEKTIGGDFLISTTPLLHDDGTLIGMVHVARDISDRKRAEQALQEAHDLLEYKVRERTSQLADTISTLQGEVNERQKAEESLRIEMLERVRVMESLRDQEKLLILQSRQAAMGEMIGNIAHQWRQPLNILGLLLQQIELFYETGKFDAEFLGQSVSKGMGIIQHMSQTIDDFRNFFRPEKEQKLFSIRESIDNTIELISDSFVSHTISIDMQNDCALEVMGYPNEFSQAILNILLNAKDVLLERRVERPRISITVDRVDGTGQIIIRDNGGGINEEIISKIFDPYFTTKGPQQGTGLGLYMAKMIIEKNMGGKLWVENGREGAAFHIEVGRVIE